MNIYVFRKSEDEHTPHHHDDPACILSRTHISILMHADHLHHFSICCRHTFTCLCAEPHPNQDENLHGIQSIAVALRTLPGDFTFASIFTARDVIKKKDAPAVDLHYSDTRGQSVPLLDVI